MEISSQSQQSTMLKAQQISSDLFVLRFCEETILIYNRDYKLATDLDAGCQYLILRCINSSLNHTEVNERFQLIIENGQYFLRANLKRSSNRHFQGMLL